MIVGITGGSGCGKTTALMAFRDLGGLVLDCDEIYHDLLRRDKALLDAIEARFPGVVEDGSLNRKALGARVFADADALLELNKIAHGAVKQEVLRRLDGLKGHAAIDAIALFEGGLGELCQVTVAITAPREQRITRLMAREGITRAYAESRLNAQKPDAWFQEMCDYTLNNNTTKEAFYQQAHNLFQNLLNAE